MKQRCIMLLLLAMPLMAMDQEKPLQEKPLQEKSLTEKLFSLYFKNATEQEIIQCMVAETLDEESWIPYSLNRLFGYEKINTALLKKVIYVNTRDYFDKTLLHYAAENGHVKVAATLLVLGANVNAKSVPVGQHSLKDITPLHLAAKNGHKDLCEKLLAAGAEVNAPAYPAYLERYNHKPSGGKTPLHMAAKGGYPDVCELLIKHKADVNARSSSSSSCHRPLHDAVCGDAKIEDKIAVCKLLVAAGADINAQACDWLPISYAKEDELYEALIELGTDVTTTRGEDCETLLHNAAWSGSIKKCELLIKNGLNVNAKTKDGSTPLHSIAWSHDELPEKLSLIKVLVKHGAEIDAQTERVGTPLLVAIHKGKLEIGRRFIELGANVNFRDDRKQTALHKAANNKKCAVVSFCEELIEAGADVQAVDDEGKTPLHVAASNGRADLCNLFVKKYGIDVNVRTEDNKTPLSEAVAHGNVETCKKLLDLGADVTIIQGFQGWTLLHKATYARKKDRVEKINLLLAHGLDPYAVSDERHTPLHIASRTGHVDTCKTLLLAMLRRKGQLPVLYKVEDIVPQKLVVLMEQIRKGCKHREIEELLTPAAVNSMVKEVIKG